MTPFALPPRSFTVTDTVPYVPAGRVTAIASRPRFADPLIATAATATATWPSAGTGTLTVAA